MNERRADQGRIRNPNHKLIIAPSSLRCVSVCCTRNGRHVLAVTDARRHAHNCVNLTLSISQDIRIKYSKNKKSERGQ